MSKDQRSIDPETGLPWGVTADGVNHTVGHPVGDSCHFDSCSGCGGYHCDLFCEGGLMSDTQQTPGYFDAMGWLQDFADCLAGDGAIPTDEADEWMERNADLPTDGTSWQHWRDHRLTRMEAQR